MQIYLKGYRLSLITLLFCKNYTKEFGMKGSDKEREKKELDEQAPIRLNKYISNAGICSRRAADVL
ncbi:hypothetical protein N9I68_04315, partial [Bacteroidia bacterium]|nr:hypothetical protein [Bacteroidia bacterium]